MSLESERTLLRKVQEMAQLGFWEWNVQDGSVLWSDELYQIFGIAERDQKLTYENYVERIHPSDREGAKSAVLRTLATHEPFTHDERILRGDGSIRYLHTWGEVIENDSAGKVTRLLGVCLDMTERKTAELRLESVVSAMQATLDSTTDGILVIDFSGRVTGYNQVFLDMWNLPGDFLVRSTYSAALHAVLNQLQEPEHCLARLEEFKKNPELEGMDILEFKDGRVYERYSRPQRLGDHVIGRVFSYRDITERRRAEAVVHQASQRMRSLLEISRKFADARLDLNSVLKEIAEKVGEYFKNGCIVRLFTPDRNRLSTVAHYHVPPELNEMMSQLLTDDQEPIDPAGMDEMLRTGKPVLVTGDPGQLNRRVPPKIRPTLERFPMHAWVIAPLRVAGRVIGAVTMFRFDPKLPSFTPEDIAWLEEVCERAAISIDNAQLYSDAQTAIQLREDFLSIASHELKTPLTPLRMQLQLLSQLLDSGTISAGPFEKRLKDLIGDSDQQIVRLNRLVEDMLDATRLRTGTLTLKKEDIDLNSLVSGVVSRLRPQFAAAKCDVELKTVGSPRGFWDRLRVEQVLTNLLTNSIKFGAGAPILISVFEQKGHACFSVRDHGIGISRTGQEKIFKRLERLVPSRQYGGLGLGLFIVRQIVEAHGGNVSVESEPTKGSVFTVKLPAKLPVITAA